MLSNYKKFGNLKNAFFYYLAIYQIYFIHYRFTESGKTQNPLGQTDKELRERPFSGFLYNYFKHGKWKNIRPSFL